MDVYPIPLINDSHASKWEENKISSSSIRIRLLGSYIKPPTVNKSHYISLSIILSINTDVKTFLFLILEKKQALCGWVNRWYCKRKNNHLWKIKRIRSPRDFMWSIRALGLQKGNEMLPRNAGPFWHFNIGSEFWNWPQETWTHSIFRSSNY